MTVESVSAASAGSPVEANASFLDIFREVSQDETRQETNANVGRRFREEDQLRAQVEEAEVQLYKTWLQALNRQTTWLQVQAAKRTWAALVVELEERVNERKLAQFAKSELLKREQGIGDNFAWPPNYCDLWPTIKELAESNQLPRQRYEVLLRSQPLRPNRGKKDVSKFKNLLPLVRPAVIKYLMEGKHTVGYYIPDSECISVGRAKFAQPKEEGAGKKGKKKNKARGGEVLELKKAEKLKSSQKPKRSKGKKK